MDINQEEEIDLLELFFILLKKWQLIVLSTFLCATCFFLYYYNTTETKYQANIKMYVNADALSFTNSISLQSLNASSSLVPIYSEILNTHLVLDKVGQKLSQKGYDGYNYFTFDEQKMISTAALNDTPVFQISVTDVDPQRAIVIANTISEVLPDEIAGIIDGSSARIVDNAKSATKLSRGTVKYTLIAGFVGFMLACVYILLVDYFLNDTLEDVEWLSSTFNDIPILGKVPDASIVVKNKYAAQYNRYHSRDYKQEEGDKK